MHQKLIEHGKFYMNNNQLPTKIPIEFKDTFNVCQKLELHNGLYL